MSLNIHKHKNLTKRRRLQDFFALQKYDAYRLAPNLQAYLMLLEEEFVF